VKRCCECHKLLTLSAYHKCITHSDGLQSKCKNCVKEYRKKYYYKHRNTAIIDAKNWQNEHIKNHNSSSRKYKKTTKGKLAAIKSRDKRERKLGFIPMFENPFADNEEIDYHHITDVYVVAVPRNLHQMYGGKYHREKTMEIVKQIYLE